MKLEAKVGAFTLLGLGLLIAIMVMLSGIKLGGSQGYSLSIGFPQAVGLTSGNDVCYAGVAVGKVDSVEPSGVGVVAAVHIDSQVKIPRKSTVIVTANGVMGGKFINIVPDKDANFEDCYGPGDFIYGLQEATMDDMMANMNNAVLKVQTLLDSMNQLLGDKETQQALKDVSINMRNITANIDSLTATLANMAQVNQGDIRQMAQNLNHMTGSLMRTADSLEVLVATFNGNGETGANLKEAIANLSATSKRIDNMAASLEGVVTDPQVADDLKATLHNVRSVSQRADDMMNTVSDIEVNAGLETMYSGKENRWQTNMGVDIRPTGNSLLRLGLNDIGEDNHFNLQGGMYNGSLGARAGVIDGKAGLGLDIGNKLQLSVDGYDPNDFKLKSRLQYEIAKDTYVFTQVNDINKADTRATYFGLRRNF